MKYAFLLAKEGPSPIQPLGYDFVPYDYGPFSFVLYRDAANLERDGYLSATGDEERWTLAASLRENTVKEVARMPIALRHAIKAVIRSYGQLTTDRLLRNVYARYPWYASRSERKDLLQGGQPSLPQGQIRVHTIGYEGKSVDGFFDELLHQGIECVIDVRRNPVSRKYGFSKTALTRIAGRLQRDYVHCPELGIPSAERRRLDSYEAYQELLDRYERQMLPRQESAIRKVQGLIERRPSVLLCVEGDPKCCHRTRLAKVIAARTGMDIREI